MLDLIKKYKYKIIFYAIIGFVICLLLIQIPYWIGKEATLIKTDFEAPDILSFLGNYISAFGTIVLGWIAIKQTDKANQISDKVAELERAKYDENHRPSVIIDWVKLHDFEYNNIACKTDFNGQLRYINANYEVDSNEQRQCIEIKFINTGHTGIYNCDLFEVNSEPEEFSKSDITLGVMDEPFVLKTSEEIKFNLFVYPNAVERFALTQIAKINLVFTCVNDFNEKYKMIFNIEGTAICAGNNRCEGQLIECTHPVKWTCVVEKE